MMKKILLLLLACTALSGNDKNFTKETFRTVEKAVDGYLVKTPLIELPSISKRAGKRVFLKDEARQKGRSFKTRGVTYEVFKTIEDVILTKPELLSEGLQLVTQTDGNHGVALILAITSAIEKFSKEYPQYESEIRKIEPIIFTYAKVLPIKRATMEEAIAEYRLHATAQGAIYDTYEDYGDAKGGREKFIAGQKGRAIYMEHGGIKTMQGHGIASLEILEQLREYKVGRHKKVCLLLPIGAGGPIGLGAALKAFRPNSTAVMVQTPRWGAFVLSYFSGKMMHNDSSLSPYTVEVMENGVMKPVVYEDGISVDAPESEEAIVMAQKYLDDAILADPKRALVDSAPLILADLDAYYKDKNISVVGGTTAIVADALLYNTSKAIREADIVVIFGTEGSIDPAIAAYTRELLEKK